MRRLASAALPVAVVAAALAGAGVPATAKPGCEPPSSAVLPVWARTGFSDPRLRVPHVLGASGRIVAILFGHPLVSPPARERANKILWVARRSPLHRSALWIRAESLDGAGTVTRVVAGGPGPSIVDLPASGCWRLRLAWARQRDVLYLRYAAG